MTDRPIVVSPLAWRVLERLCLVIFRSMHISELYTALQLFQFPDAVLSVGVKSVFSYLSPCLLSRTDQVS